MFKTIICFLGYLLIADYGYGACLGNELPALERTRFAANVLLERISSDKKAGVTNFSDQVGNGASAQVGEFTHGGEVMYLVQATSGKDSVNGVLRCDPNKRALSVISYSWNTKQGTGISGGKKF